MKQLIQRAERVIAINSVTSNGNEELAQYAMELMQDAGLQTTLQPVSHSLEGFSKRQFNVIGILGDTLVDRKTKKGLLLNTHLDTVSPGRVENWTECDRNPFKAVVKDGKIFGLGSADVKLDFLCKLYAIETFRERKLKMPIYLVGTCGEEVGMFGARYLIKSLALNPKFVVVGEPSQLKVVIAHKCLGIFKVSVDYQLVERDARGFNRRVDLFSMGKSAHGSYPHLGTNAIHQAIRFTQAALENGFELRFTKFEGGDSKNKVPDQALIEFYLTSHQFEDFKRFYRDWTRLHSLETSFRADLGGLGESGVKFFPEAIYPCVVSAVDVFSQVASEAERLKDPNYNPPFSTVNLSMIKQRPTGIDIYFDLRVLPQTDPESVFAEIKTRMAKVAAQHPQVNLSVQRERTNPGLNMTEDSELARHCKQALLDSKIPVVFDHKSTSTEAAQYFAAGFDSVVFGPGLSMGNSHSPNEFNLLDDLEKAVNFYQNLIARICT